MGMLRYILVFIISLSAAPAFAWGDDGHHLVCQIAYERLTPATRTKVEAIIASNSRGPTNFAAACTYADSWRARFKDIDPIKARSAHHFVNLRRGDTQIDHEHCGVASTREGCAFTAITRDLATLSSPKTSSYNKWRALVFLGHFVGDLHQPLHVSFKGDGGGNGVMISGDCTDLNIDNLHSVWDSCIIRKEVYRRTVKLDAFYEDPLFHQTAQELATVSDVDANLWISEPRYMWGQESFAITTQDNVLYCHRESQTSPCNAVGRYGRDSKGKRKRVSDLPTSPTSYAATFAPTVRDRLSRAGVRLAALLELALKD